MPRPGRAHFLVALSHGQILDTGADRCGRRRRSFRALAPIVLVVLVAVHGSERIAVAAEASAPIRLQPGRVISRSMAPADHHEFVLDLRAGEVAVVTVRQRGIDVVLTVADPEGRERHRVDRPNVDWGRETITVSLT